MIIIDNFIEIHNDHIRVREATKQGYAIGIDGDSINLEHPNSKTRRGRIGHQIAQTLTCSCNQGVIIEVNKIIRLGNIYPSKGQNGEIYHEDGLSPTISSGQGKTGNGIGSNNAPKILTSNKLNDEGDNIMKEFTNNLTKYNFKMDTIKVFDAFAGIGALHQSLKELGIPIKITGLSEIDVDVIIEYAGVHISNFANLEFKYPSEDEMRKWLIDRNIGWSFEKNKSCIPRLKKDKLYNVYKASILLNNLGDISKLDCDHIEDFDLFNLSFSCTDISNAGQQKGLKNADGTPTRSGLVVYGQKVIKAKRPKYIMIENVKALIQKKFIDDFYDIVNEIESYGYKCYYPTVTDIKKGTVKPNCLNAKDYGIAQNRERIFVICVRNDIDDGLFEFPKGFDSDLKLKDFLEDEVDEKYYIKKTKDFFIKNSFDMEAKGNGFRFEPHIKQNASVSKTITTRAGARMDDNFILDNLNIEEEKFKFDTKNPYFNNADNINPDDFKIRKLTPKECWRLMGFRDECIDRMMELGISESALYKSAGNSIVVNCLYYIFKELFTKYIIE